jgi:alpha-ketoglutarate-dependent taurine dioxygenase
VIVISREQPAGAPYQIWRTTGGEATLDDTCAWLADQKPLITSVLNSRGALVLRGLRSIDSAEDFDRAIRVVFSGLRDYVGGTSPRERVSGKIMTATSIPANWSIPLHQEMSYAVDPPSRIAFFSQTAVTGTGGETTLGDMAGVLRRLSPEVRERFAGRGLQLRRTLPSAASARHKPGVKKLWTEAFATTDRDQAEQMARARGWEVRWLPGDTLQLYQDVLPSTKRHPVSGKEVWFNQVQLFSPACLLAWARRDGRTQDWREIDHARREHPEMLDDIVHGDGEPVSDADALHIDKVLTEAEAPVTLEKSDLVLIDNTLVSHGRRPFTGHRNLLVALADEPTGDPRDG